MKSLAIMQPYFLPYLGYWQLIHSVDEFVVYDNIEYTKKGWFNRNRILDHGKDRLFTVPIKKDSDYLDVRDRCLADESSQEIARALRVIAGTYKKAPYFEKAYPVIEECFLFDEKNLFQYIFHSLEVVSEYLGIQTPLVISSTVKADHTLKAEEKVMAICKAQQAGIYVNSIGGQELYDKARFKENGIALSFLRPRLEAYSQFTEPFVPGLSIIDIMMFNSPDDIKKMLDAYELV